MAESVHGKLGRVRKARTHITFDVDVGDGVQETTELPFIVGVLGDFSGNSDVEKKALSERKFIDLRKDTFNNVMGAIAPGVKIDVPNTIEKNGNDMPVALTFRTMEDFNPDRVAMQVEPLRRLMERRNQLHDLLAKAGLSEDLQKLLKDILQDKSKIQELATELDAAAATATKE